MQIIVTGAAGNLGSKLVAHLEAADWCTSIIGIDIVDFKTGPKTTAVVADIADADDSRWRDHAITADGIVHYASANPAPNSTWEQSAKSFDMTANLLEQAGGGTKPCRFVFASSNHAMGGYKDAPIPGDGKLRMATPQMSGTRYWTPAGYRWGSAYGATKMLGERECIARANATNGRITAVATRIGWCQAGENKAVTITGGGASDEGDPDPTEQARNLNWFRNMWLSDPDHLRLMEAALTSDTTAWPGPAIVVNGMSNNDGMAWDLEDGANWIGYRPQDNIWADLKAAGIV